jgi:hypothetical protein
MKSFLTLFRFLALGVLVATAASSRGSADAPRVPFPEGYRSWFHVKSATVNEGNKSFAKFGGIHHIYANPAAVRGFAAGEFEDGSILVFDLLEFHTGEDFATREGARRHIDVMVKDATRFKSTSGWGFEEFTSKTGKAGTLSAEAAQACATCHATRKQTDGVFSSIRE